jgi:hypothetical protein
MILAPAREGREAPALGQVAGEHARVVVVVPAPRVHAVRHARTVGARQLDQRCAEAEQDLPHGTGGREDDPAEVAGQQVCRQLRDHADRAAAVARGEVAHLDDLGPAQRLAGGAGDRVLDGLVQVVLEVERRRGGRAQAQHAPQPLLAVAEAQQRRHERLDLGGVGARERRAHERLELGPLAVAGAGLRQLQGDCAGRRGLRRIHRSCLTVHGIQVATPRGWFRRGEVRHVPGLDDRTGRNQSRRCQRLAMSCHIKCLGAPNRRPGPAGD